MTRNSTDLVKRKTIVFSSIFLIMNPSDDTDSSMNTFWIKKGTEKESKERLFSGTLSILLSIKRVSSTLSLFINYKGVLVIVSTILDLTDCRWHQEKGITIVSYTSYYKTSYDILGSTLESLLWMEVFSLILNCNHPKKLDSKLTFSLNDV